MGAPVSHTACGLILEVFPQIYTTSKLHVTISGNNFLIQILVMFMGAPTHSVIILVRVWLQYWLERLNLNEPHNFLVIYM